MSLTDFDEKYGEKGKGLIRQLGTGVDKRILLDSGVFGLNVAHGIGGIKTGSVIQLMGPPGLGKSSISYRLVADGLSKGMSGLIIDTEAGINEAILMDTIEELGIDPEDPNLPLRYATATNLADVSWSKGHPTSTDKKPVLTLQRMIPLIEEWILDPKISPNGAVVVIDSIDMIVPETTVGSKVDDATVALVAKNMKNWLRMFNGTIRGTGSMVIFVHQVSSKINGYGGDNETFFGGNAVRHNASFSLRLKDIGQELGKGDEIIGRKVKGTITKSKQGKSWRSFEYVIRYDAGPDNIGAVFDAGVKLKLITGKGWYSGPGIPGQIQGKENVREHWVNNPSDFRIAQDAVMQLAMEVPEEVTDDVDMVEQTSLNEEVYDVPYEEES